MGKGRVVGIATITTCCSHGTRRQACSTGSNARVEEANHALQLRSLAYSAKVTFVKLTMSQGGHGLNVILDHAVIKAEARSFSFFFFFQAEDGIRDVAVTGVQTCALPI